MRGRLRARGSTWYLGFLFGVAGLGGCGSDSFAPPPPEGLREALSSKSPQVAKKTESGARPVEVLLAPRDLDAATANANYAVTQGGYDSVLVHPEAPPETTTPAGQADLVEAAIKTKPPVLIIEPAEKPDARLATLIGQARDQGIPVVLIGSSMNKIPGVEKASDDAAKASGKAPLILVDSVPFADSAKQLVKSALRVAKNAKLDPQGGAILYYSLHADPLATARVEAVRAALTEAGIKNQFEVKFDPAPGAADAALKAELAKQPKATLLIPFDFRTYMSTLTVTTALQDSRDLVVVGYNSEERSPFLRDIPNMAAVAEFRPARLIRQAVRLAGALIRGETVSPVTSIPVDFFDSAPNMGIPELRPKNRPKPVDDLSQE